MRGEDAGERRHPQGVDGVQEKIAYEEVVSELKQEGLLADFAGAMTPEARQNVLGSELITEIETRFKQDGIESGFDISKAWNAARAAEGVRGLGTRER